MMRDGKRSMYNVYFPLSHGGRPSTWLAISICRNVTIRYYISYTSLRSKETRWWLVPLIPDNSTYWHGSYNISRCQELNLAMLKLLRPKHKNAMIFWKTSKPCHVGIHWIALAEHSHMSTHVPVFQSFSGVFAFAKLATSSISLRVKTPFP